MDRPGDATELKEGMVLVLNPHVQGPGGTILYSRDTVLLDFNGCKILGWYKDWARALRRVRLLLQRRRLIWARLRVSGAAPQGSHSRA